MGHVTEAPEDLAVAHPQPLIPAAKVKIVGGMSDYALEDPPEYGEYRTYIVKAWCKKQHIDQVDGEPRMVVDMCQVSIHERGKVPIVDEAQPGLFDSADEVSGVAEGEGEAETADAGWDDTVRVTGEPTKAFAGGPQFSGVEPEGGEGSSET